MMADKKRILMTGVSGLLGNNLAFCLKGQYDILGLFNEHAANIPGIKIAKANLTSEQEVRAIIDEFKPEVIVHCAALSDIDCCEENQGLAHKINVLGTKQLVDLSKGRGTKFIYISTDAVYGEVNGVVLCEDDRINPVNYYGQTKYGGEQEALKGHNVLVLRTNIFGWNIQDKYSIAEWIVHELAHGREIQGFRDVYFSSIYTFELSKILNQAIEKDIRGIYNCGSRTSMSKYEFAMKLADYFKLNKSLIRPISIDDFSFKAKRRKNLGMNIRKLEVALDFVAPTLEESIEHFYKDYQNGVPEEIKPTVFSRVDYIPYGRQTIDEEDIQSVISVLRSKNLTQGPKIVEFEELLIETVGANHCVAVNSGTSALHIACLAAGIGPGDEVITSPNTFVASANCVVYCGGRPVFADIDPKTYNISPVEIEKKINEKTKAIIPVHFAGQSCDMEAIEKIVRTSEKKCGHKIYIIEDACHALGSRYKETKVGSCAYSDMAVMSFHPVKHITTGEGGCVLTNDTDLRRKLRYFRSHGITSDPDEFFDKENGFEKGVGTEDRIKKRWYYEQNCLGYNYRIADIQCALGISQLKKIGKFCQRRRGIVKYYNAAFKGIQWLIIPFEEKFCDSNFHLYVLLFDFDKIGMTRAQVMAELEKKRIQTQAHYIPVYTQPFYRKNFGTNWGDCPESERYYKRCLSIPLFPAMSDQDLKHVSEGIKDLITE